MFDVKHWFSKLNITQAAFLVFVASIPYQLRTILNMDAAYIDYAFNYHLAIFFYASDFLFLVFLVSWLVYDRQVEKRDWVFILGFLSAFTALFHVEQWGLWAYNLAKISQFLMILLYMRHNPLLFKPILWIIYVSGIIQAGIGIWQFHDQLGVGLTWLGEYLPDALAQGSATLYMAGQKILRAYGTMPHPNVYGGFLAISLLFGLHVSRGTSIWWHKLFVSCGTIVILWGIIVSFSRSAWLAAIFALLAYFAIDIVKNRTKSSLLPWLLIIVSCGTLVMAYKTYVLPRSTDVSLNSQAANYRETFNQLGINVIKQHPLTGIGLGQYIPYLRQTVELEPWAYQPPHNVFILILTEIGIVGVFFRLLAISQLGFTWNIGKYQYHILNSIVWTLIGIILILGMLDHYLVTIQQGRLLLVLCIGLIVFNQKIVSQAVKQFSEPNQG